MPYAVVLGSPIAHSLSPVLWCAAYAELGLDWTYAAVECTEEQLGATLATLAADLDWRAASLTMPLKRAVLALPDLVDVVDPTARAISAVNTVVRAGDRLHGHNTDVSGVIGALTAAGVGAGRTLVLGGGGTASAVLAALDRLGWPPPTFLLRDLARAAPLRAAAEALGTELLVAPWGSVDLRDADLVVNTTPAGAADSVAEAGAWSGTCALFEVLYHPWPTPLVRAALAAGAIVVGGLDLLAHQAVGQIELATGRRPAVESLLAAGSRSLS